MTIRRTAIMLLLGASLLSGCFSLRTAISDEMIAIRNYEQARGAWASCRDIYVDCEPNLYDFGLGFRAGYVAVAGGGNGCPPTLPPQRYWGARFQNDSGRAQAVSWYNGYSHGVEVAMADGVGGNSGMVTSLELYPQCRTTAEIQLPSSTDMNLQPLEMDPYGNDPGMLAPQAPQLNAPPTELY